MLKPKQNLYIKYKLYLIRKIIYNSINPGSVIYNLHQRHGQFSGFQNLIFHWAMLTFSKSVSLLGKGLHIFGPSKDIISEP